jgi:hypothetical protein
MNIPEPGFYYHYKHDKNGSINNYAYEVVGVGHHTEEQDTYFVNYRPLYDTAFGYSSILEDSRSFVDCSVKGNS